VRYIAFDRESKMAPMGNNRNGMFSESELRAVEHSVFGGRRVLWAGVLAVLLPLAILLALQYWWLTDLERNSAIAREAALKNYLEAITKEVHYYYWKISERALNLPPEIFGEKKMGKAAAYFKKKEIKGAKRLFVVSFLSRESLLFYDSKHKKMVVPKHSDESVAVWAAASPWSYLRRKGTKIETTTLSADLHDPRNRIILNPITDEHYKLVGLAGMIVDQGFFVEAILPKAIEVSLPKFEDKEKGELLVVVRDSQRRQILPDGEKANPKKDRVSRSFAFVFTDWYISLQGDFASPEKWARANFAYNMTLSAVLAAVLLGGIALTIRTALREMKLSAMKNAFVSNVSHELRTPLSSIRVFGEFMRRGRVEDSEKVREYGSYIETESRRLTQLINNILDFSRIESGRKVYTFEDADLEEILAGTLATFTVRLRDKGFDVSYEGPDEPLPDLEVDPNAIDRAVANLLDNAVKYSDGDRAIHVKLDRTNGEAIISVADHGIGIPPDEQERIFERFHRVSTGLVHDVKGSGLGLSLVRHIAEAHGGTVTVESEVGRGSTFTIHLPLAGSDGEDT
jgi:signal transduction histidine kinase